MTNRKRIAALLLCIGLIAALSVSAAFIAIEADHDCCGEDCPVCRTIAVNIRLLRTLALACAALGVFCFLRSGRNARRPRDRYAAVIPGTLVSWKIRLDD